MGFNLYEVGGAVRDSFLGRSSKDIDYSVEYDFPTTDDMPADFVYDRMIEWLESEGFKVFLSKPEYLTARARFPEGHEHASLTADFVLCRREGAYSDGRHPDEVFVGTIFDDLARRDFTMNAIARAEDGWILDPWNGRTHIKMSILKAVGDPEVRIREDALRALRAIRFLMVLDLECIDSELAEVLRADWLPPLLAKVSKERRREELTKAFRHDTIRTMVTLAQYPADFSEAIFQDIWLKPTVGS